MNEWSRYSNSALGWSSCPLGSFQLDISFKQLNACLWPFVRLRENSCYELGCNCMDMAEVSKIRIDFCVAVILLLNLISTFH